MFRVASFVCSVEVDSFDDLRPSAESGELRFFTREDLNALDLAETQRPIFDALLGSGRPPHLL